MKHLSGFIGIVFAILIAGCSLSTPSPVPTSTPTAGRFIRVASPTFTPRNTPRVTIEPTMEIRSTSTITVPTLTPTPIPITVSNLPDPSGYSWELVVNGLDKPEGLDNAGDGSGRLFIIEQGGLVRILMDGALLPTPFLDLTQKVDCCGRRCGNRRCEIFAGNDG